MDLPGSLTVTCGLVAVVLGVTWTAQWGWGSPWAVGTLVLGVALLTAFWWIERAVQHPLVSTRMLARRTVGGGSLGGLVTFTFMSAVVFLMTIYLQEALKYSALVTGLAFACWNRCLLRRYGGAAHHRAAEQPEFAGASPAHPGRRHGRAADRGSQPDGIVIMIVATTVGGFGHVLAIVSFMVTVTQGVPDEEQGRATALTSVTQQVGLTIGTPIISAIATGRIKVLQSTLPYTSAVVGGVHLGTLVDAAAVLAGALVIAMLLRPARSARPGADAAAAATAAASATVAASEGDR